MQTGHLIYKCGGIDKRTIEKFEKVSSIHIPRSSSICVSHTSCLLASKYPSISASRLKFPPPRSPLCPSSYRRAHKAISENFECTDHLTPLRDAFVRSLRLWRHGDLFS